MKQLSICKLVLMGALSVFSFNAIAADPAPAPTGAPAAADKKDADKKDEKKDGKTADVKPAAPAGH